MGPAHLGAGEAAAASLGSKAAPSLLWDQTGPFAPLVKEPDSSPPSTQSPGPHCPGALGRGGRRRAAGTLWSPFPAAHSPQPTRTGPTAAAFAASFACPSTRLRPSACRLSEPPLPGARNGPRVRKALPRPEREAAATPPATSPFSSLRPRRAEQASRATRASTGQRTVPTPLRAPRTGGETPESREHLTDSRGRPSLRDAGLRVQDGRTDRHGTALWL